VPAAASPVAVPSSAVVAKPQNDPWNDLEQLIGYNKGLEASGGSPAADDEEFDELPPPRAYRATPKPRRNYAAILLAVVGVALVGGGAYAVWLNRDALDSMIGGVFASKSATPQANVASAPATPAKATANTTAPAGQPAAAPSSAAATAAGSGAAPAGPQKFTQRLLADGTEVDQGAGNAQVGGSGQSVAQLTPPSATPAQAQQGQSSPVTPAQNAPTATPSNTPAVSGEKIFLYEERIGQTSPTAVEGTASWSLQHEAGEDGRPQAIVQGRISVPGRGMTALVTFKRNSDASLPASHLVELVFSLPQDFEGGAIDSVQRIAMKQSEQDRGTPLVAVPAKITDDFHMIALNDFPDARATNLDLLRTRNWMDIPLIYRNGRRALLTLQKGPQGIKAFEDAIREWNAAAPAKSGQ
jgi:hypothetical protein